MLKGFYKLLVRLAGENHEAYKVCAVNTRYRIRITGFIVLVIFILSFLSSMEAFTEFFHSVWIGLLIGLFFGWVVTNMYLFLLYTITRNVLVPTDVKAHSLLSLGLRLGTVAFFALIVSKPIEHFLFKKQVETQLKEYKHTAFSQLENSINKNYTQRIKEAKPNDKARLILLQTAEITRMSNLVLNNEYYFRAIGYLNQKPLMWVISLLFILLFCLPIYLKRGIPVDSVYYKNKTKLYRAVVDKAYSDFAKEYLEKIQKSLNTIKQLEGKTPEKAYISETYLDPPYNFHKKTTQASTQSEKEFIAQLYS